jgi:hypothetical protein
MRQDDIFPIQIEDIDPIGRTVAPRTPGGPELNVHTSMDRS